MAGQMRAEATPSLGRLCPAIRGVSTCLAGSRSRSMRFLRGAVMRWTPQSRGVWGPVRALQALLQRVHQADDGVRLFLALGNFHGLARGHAPNQRFQGILVFV